VRICCQLFAIHRGKRSNTNGLQDTRQIYADLHRDVGTAVRESHALIERMTTEPDFAEGVAAFLDKRLPRWKRG
jgi:enoyl-CoA hydratase/carnithine racemase